MKKIFTYLFISFCTINISLAQVTQEWAAIYPNSSANTGAIDDSGNVYITGVCWLIDSHDIITIKYNSSGVLQWVKTYNGTYSYMDIGYSIDVDKWGNVYITGVTNWNSYYTTSDYCTIKYSSSGILQWVQIYNGSGNSIDIAFSLKTDDSGNTYVTGQSVGDNYTGYDCVTIKYNTSGVKQWETRYTGSIDDYQKFNGAIALVLDRLGNVYITGSSCWIDSLSNDYCTIKYNSSGVEQWVRRYNGTGNWFDETTSIALDKLGNIYVTGGCTGSSYNSHFVTIKYNSSGDSIWTQKYFSPGGAYEDKATSIAVDSSSNVYITGYSTGTGTQRDFATIKYNSSGVQQWVQRYNDPYNNLDIPSSIKIDKYDNVYVTGFSDNSPRPGSGSGWDYTTIKYNSSGVQQWLQIYNSPSNSSTDYANFLGLDKFNNVFVSGSSVQGLTTIKYSQFVGTNPSSTHIPDRFELSQNYPNPFNPSTRIRFSIPPKRGARGVEHVVLKIYDITGREVATLINGKLEAGIHEVDWNAGDFASGVYFYSLQAGEFVETRKLVLIK
ncbi:MAG: T9SS C-terminal target domain-containing protein [Ignavibacteriae bacterium]|nr:MAG: T9SS C-terminal target domain-containing protein [Ignavibacteriota bacterium]